MRTFLIAALTASLLFSPALARKSDTLRVNTRTEVVAAIADTIETHFFDAVRAGEVANSLREAEASGAFANADTGEALAAALNTFLEPYDRHFGVVSGVPEPEESDAPTESPFAWYQMFKTSNYGFQRAEIIDGNVGYIDLRVFVPTHYAGDAGATALRFIRDTQAVIFDLRENRGGNPSMVQFIASHFFDPLDPVVLNTFISREAEYPTELRSLSYAPAGARPYVPVYILTSERTASAAESFAYAMQALGRATVVGQTTRGAANPGASFYVGHGFTVFISTKTTKNPVTGENWEGKGVSPDISAPASQAFDVALAEVYSSLLNVQNLDDAERQKLEWAREAALSRTTPATINDINPSDYPGDYGVRTIRLEDGRLIYQREGNEPLALIPLAKDRFYLEGLPNEYRVQFIRNKKGAVIGFELQTESGERIMNNRKLDGPSASDG